MVIVVPVASGGGGINVGTASVRPSTVDGGGHAGLQKQLA